MQVEKEVFGRKEFKVALKKCFVKAGQLPQEDGSYVKFTGKGKVSSLLKQLLPTGVVEDSEGTLALVAGGADSGAAEEPESDEEDDDEPDKDDDEPDSDDDDEQEDA